MIFSKDEGTLRAPPQDPRKIPHLPARFDWPNCWLDRQGGIAIERYRIADHSAIWAVGNAYSDKPIRGMLLRLPVLIERVDDDQIIFGTSKADTTSPLTSACISASYSILDNIEKRQLAYEGDLDPVINFRAIIQAVAARYMVDPTEMMAQYPKIRTKLNTLSYTSPHDIDVAMRAKAANDYIDGRL